jgi:hypothetical protein
MFAPYIVGVGDAEGAPVSGPPKIVVTAAAAAPSLPTTRTLGRVGADAGAGAGEGRVVDVDFVAGASGPAGSTVVWTTASAATLTPIPTTVRDDALTDSLVPSGNRIATLAPSAGHCTLGST